MALSGKKGRQTATIGELISRYAEAAREHATATAAGDYRVTNRAHDVIADIYGELRKRGTAAQHALLPLLRDESMSVRLWAGVHALDFSPDEGEAELEAIAGSAPSPLRLAAEMSLREWRTGQFRLP